MGLNAQEHLTQSYEARDVQNGGRRKVVKLESIELQEPPEKRDVWEIRVPLLGRGRSIPALLWKGWGRSPPAFHPGRWPVRLEPEP